MAFFDWLEHSAFSMWIKEPDNVWLGYDLFLASHAVGMAFLVGLSSAVALRILGFAPRVPLGPLEKFFPLMYAGFWVNAISGVVLFAIYPLMPLGNPGFYVKLSGVVLAVLCVRRIRRVVFGDPVCRGLAPVPLQGKALAGTLLFLWLIVITAGRLMAYHGIANVERQVALGMAFIVPALLAAGWAGRRFVWTRA